MRKLLPLLYCLSILLTVKGQAPLQLNYQGVARSSNGNAIQNTLIALRLTIHDGSAAGPVVYAETRTVTTNLFGLFNIAVGSPGALTVTGSVGSINWAGGNKFLQVELDPNGGSSFLNMATTQLLAVPYALYSAAAPPVGAAGGDLSGSYPNPLVAGIRGVNVSAIAPVANYLLGFDGANWTPVSLATHPDNYWRLSGSNIYNANSGNTGIGTATPAYKLDVNGTLQTQGFLMPTGAGAGRLLMSDAGGMGSWTSTVAATSIVLPYKDSASSDTKNIFHIIQTSPASSTGALFGATRSMAPNAFGSGGVVSSNSAGAFSAGVLGQNLSTTGLGIGVYGAQSGSGWGVFGTTPSGVGVYGNSNSYYGVYGFSNGSSGVFGQSASGYGYLAGVFGYAPNSGGNGTFGYALKNYGFGAIGIADSSTGVYGQTNSLTYQAVQNDGVAVYGLATHGGVGVYGNSSTGRAALFENTNAANSTTTLQASSNGTGRAIVARSNLPGYVNAGVIDALTTVVGGNAIFGHGTRSGGWGVFGLSDSSAGVAGLGWTKTAAGVYGQGYGGMAAQFVIDNSFKNDTDVINVSTTQGGNGIVVNVNNSARGVFASQKGGGFGLYGTSAAGIGVGGYGNAHAGVYGLSNTASGVFGQSASGAGYIAGVFGYSTNGGGNGTFGYALKNLGFGAVGIADSSTGVFGQTNALTYAATQNDGVAVSGIATNGGTGIYGRSNTGTAAFLENTNAANPSTMMNINSNGTGRAIVARSNYPGYVNAGVIDALTTVIGGNAIFGRGTRAGGWGVYGLSDSAAGVAGFGWRPSSVGVYGQSYNGTAAQFVIDNSGGVNNSNVVNVSTTQGGNGIAVNLNNGANGISVNQQGSGAGIYATSNSGIGISGYGNIHAGIYGISNTRSGVFGQSASGAGYIAGVFGYSTNGGGNGIFGYALKNLGFGAVGIADSSTGVFGQTNALTYAATQNDGVAVSGIATNGGTGIYGRSNTGAAAFFENTNTANSSTMVNISSNGTGRAIVARSNYPGYVNAGVVDALTTVVGGNAIFGRGTRAGGWGVYGLSDSAAGVAGFGWRPSSVGVYGQSYTGTAAQFVIDNSGGMNNSDVVDVSTTQGGNGVVVSLTNAARGIDVEQNGAGIGVYAKSNGGYAGYFVGNVYVSGTLSKGAGSFKIDHPQDPQNKYLVHSFVESPDMMNVYNGNIVTDAGGRAAVNLPAYFEAENMDFKYQLTVIGQFAQAIVSEEIKNNQFVILTDKPGVKVSWQVTGVRNDKFAQQNRIVPELTKAGAEKGRYINPEVYGRPREEGIAYLEAGAPGTEKDGGAGYRIAAAGQYRQNPVKNSQAEKAGRIAAEQDRMVSGERQPFGADRGARGKFSGVASQELKAEADAAAKLGQGMQENAASGPLLSRSQKQKDRETAQQPSDAQAEKTKKMAGSIAQVKEETRTAGEASPKKGKDLGSPDKLKQLAASHAERMVQDSSMAPPRGSDKVKQMLSEGRSQAAAKMNAEGEQPANTADRKKLLKPDVKLPQGQGEPQKKVQ